MERRGNLDSRELIPQICSLEREREKGKFEAFVAFDV